ncbi:MAG: MATE family efflux transporter [Candidatus Absconditabacteria bacterium]
MGKYQDKSLGSQPIPQLLIKYILPAVIGTIGLALYNLIDRIFIGHYVGELGIAGITLSFPFFLIIMATGMFFGIGIGYLTSIRLGEGNKSEAEKLLGNAFFIYTIVGLIWLILIRPFTDNILMLFGATAKTLPYASVYVKIILLGVVLQYYSMGLSSFIRSEGSPKASMIIFLVGTMLNIILDYVFLEYFHWGMAGVAYATVISLIVNATLTVGYFVVGPSVLKLKLKNIRLNLKLVTPGLKIGLAPLILQSMNAFIAIFTNIVISKYGGDEGVAFIGITNTISMFVGMMLMGVAQGAQPIWGYNYGAKLYDRVIVTTKYILGITFVVSLFATFIIQVFPLQIFNLFIDGNNNLLSLGISSFQIYLFFIVGLSMQMVSVIFFQAVNHPKYAIFMNIFKPVLFVVSVLILTHYFGLKGFWFGAPIADLIGGVVAFILVLRLVRKLRLLRNSQIASQ